MNKIDRAGDTGGLVGGKGGAWLPPHFFTWQKEKRETKAKKKGFQGRNYQKAVTKFKILF